MPLNIVPREKWRAVSATTSRVLKVTPATHVFLVATGTRPCWSNSECAAQMRALQDIHMKQEGQRDIRYHFAVGGDGSVYEGRGWKVTTMAPMGLNHCSYVIGFIGDFKAHTLPDLMFKVGRELIQFGIGLKFIDQNFTPHEMFDLVPAGDRGHVRV